MRTNFPNRAAFGAADEVHEVAVVMEKGSAFTVDIAADIGALPLNPDVRDFRKGWLLNVDMGHAVKLDGWLPTAGAAFL